MNFRLLIFIFSVLFSVGSKAQNCPALLIKDALGNDSANIDCNYPFVNNFCLTLNATSPLLNSTSSYIANTETYAPPAPFNQGTQVNLTDDLFSQEIPLPFQFCFYGTLHNSLVISSNGFITFDVSKANNISSPRILGSLEDPSSVKLPYNSVYGVMQDLFFTNNADSGIFYTTVGTAPCRKFIISFYNGEMVGCPDLKATSQIVLSEGTNQIEVFVEKKPAVCSTIKFPESVIGILNEDGTTSVAAPNRNTGTWEAALEAYTFNPNGPAIKPTISWYDSNNQLVGTGESATVCPQENQIYTAKASYFTCGPDPYVISDDFSVTMGPSFPVVKNFTQIFCEAPPKEVNLSSFNPSVTTQNAADFIFKYYNTQAEADLGGPALADQQTISGNTTFYVRVENPANTTCYKVAVLQIEFVIQSLATDTVEICDAGNDGIEPNYPLSTLDPKLIPANAGGTLIYFLSQSDADNNINPVTSANLTPNTKLWVRYSLNTCSKVFGPINLIFNPVPAVNTPIDFQHTMCDINANGVEPFKWEQVLGSQITTDPNVSAMHFYLSLADAIIGGTSTEISTITQGTYTVFVRVEYATGCFAIAEIHVVSVFTKIEANNVNQYLCFQGNQTYNFDLNAISAGMLISPLDGTVTITYHNTNADAEANINPISANQSYTPPVGVKSKTYYVRFHKAVDCYTVRAINIFFVHPEPEKSSFQVCDRDNDNTETVTLSNYSSQIIGNQDATVAYFTDQAATNPISTLTISSTSTIYVKMTSHDCSEIYPVTFSLVKTPTVTPNIDINLQNICNNNNSGQSVYDATPLTSQIYTGSETVTFSYYSNYNTTSNTFSGPIADPTVIPVPGNITFYVKTTLSSGCFSVTKVNVTMKFLPAVILKPATLYQCDVSFDANETYNLNDAVPQMFTQTDNSISLSDLTITYYKTEADANSGTNPVSNSVVSETPSEYYYARFTTKDGCYSVAAILLKSKYPPKALLTVIPDVCDQNLDGSYDVDLTKFQNNLVQFADPDNNFTYYLTEADALSGNNPVATPNDFHPVVGQRIWFRVQSVSRCFDVNYIDFKMGNKAAVNAGPYQLNNVCDSGNDGRETVDLTQFESQMYAGTATFEYFPTLLDLNLNKNAIPSPAAYAYDKASPNSGDIFVKVSVAGFCPNLSKINITLKKVPIFSMSDYFFCPHGSVDIKPDFSGLDLQSIEWVSPSGNVSQGSQLLNVNEEGIYTVNVVANNGCTFSTKFSVKMYEVPVIKELIPSGNSFTVIATGSKKILYSIDGITWQESNVFQNLPNGVTTFYVKFEDATCIGEPKKGLILDVPNVVTPNGDGVNDTWEVNNLSVFDGQTSTVKIFDRYGNLIFSQESATQFLWDGYWLKRPAPTASYWYVITLPDGRIYNSWILVKNRN